MMDTRRYVASSVAEGLLNVRRELGTDALILSVKEDKDPLTGERKSVEILASSQPRAAAPRPSASVREADPEDLLASFYGNANRNAPHQTPRPRPRATAQAIPQPAPMPKPQAPSRQAIHRAALQAARAELHHASPAVPEPSLPVLDIRHELGHILPGPPAGGAVANLFFYLLDSGIDREIAEEMIERLSKHLDPRRGWPRDKVRGFLCDLINREVQCGGAFRHIKRGRIAAFVGPTGVGKTTTIAKIATRLVRNNTTVGLITLDQFRVGAYDQLKKFAQALNVPLLAATNKADFHAALRVFRSRQAVLIDTTGQNPRDLDVLDRVSETLRSVEGLEKHLVLSAPTKERDLLGFVELYRKIGFNYLIFSKLDETATYGGMLNSYFAADKPFSYFSMGQRVPEDLVEASTEQLNDLMFQ